MRYQRISSSRLTSLALAAATTLAGFSCAQKKPTTTPLTPTDPAPRWVGQGPRFLRYEDLTPKVDLPPGPSTQATTQPAPVDALDLYARARGAMLQGRPTLARQLLERAAQLDPMSSEIQKLLAQAYIEDDTSPGGFTPNATLDRSAKALARAGELAPDNGDTWLKLGRLELNRDRKPEALTALRRAALTSDYRDRATFAATVDLYLARVLQSLGYDRAAVDRYDRVLTAVGGLTTSLRESPELALVAERPEVILSELGQIYERNNQYIDAARVYQAAAERDDESFEPHARYVRALAKAGQSDQAMAAAGQVVVRFRADARSMALLDEVYTLAGRKDQLLTDLRKLHDQRPGDKAVLLALVESLRHSGKPGTDLDAERLLESAATSGSAPDVVLLSRLTDMKAARGDITGAAVTAIRAAAASPSAERYMFRVISDLCRPSRDNRLKFRDLRNLPVGSDPATQAARNFFASRLASDQGNPTTAANCLRSAWRLYPPALLLYTERTLTAGAPGKREATVAEIMSVARTLGDGLPQAVDGRRLVQEGNAPAAARTLSEAIDHGTRDVRTQMLLAIALARSGQGALAQQVLARLATENPGDDEIQSQWAALQATALGSAAGTGAAEQVVSDWLRANPSSGQAKATAAVLANARSDTQSALRLASEVLETSPDDETAISAAEQIYLGLNKTPDWNKAVTARFDRSPRALPLLSRVIRNGLESSDDAALTAALQKSRAASIDDPEMLYQIAQLAMVANHRPLARDILADSLKYSPVHPVAANDWAYETSELTPVAPADQLAQAERFSRLALEQDPDNPAFIDTLGWILYKRGDYASACKQLERAISLSREPDPTILDHLGDATWRLGQKDLALQHWLEAQRLLNGGRPDNPLLNPPQINLPPDAIASPEQSLRANLRKKVDAVHGNSEPPVADSRP